MESKVETYSFNHFDADGIMTTISFTVPAEGTRISTLHAMCRRFALALGYTERSVDEYFGEEEGFIEFLK